MLDSVDDARFLVDVPMAQRDEAANSRSAPKTAALLHSTQRARLGSGNNAEPRRCATACGVARLHYCRADGRGASTDALGQKARKAR